MIAERSRPISRAGSARISRPNSWGRQNSKQRPSSAPTPGSAKVTIRYGNTPESSPLVGLRIDGKSVGISVVRVIQIVFLISLTK